MIRSVVTGVAVIAAMMLGVWVAPAFAADPPAAFEKGRIVVEPQDLSLDPYTATFPVGENEIPLLEALKQAATAGSVDLESYPKVTVAGRTFTRDQVATGVPTIVFGEDRTTVRFPGGESRVYGPGQAAGYTATPVVTVQQKATDFRVVISPGKKRVKSGDTVRFHATVTGTTGALTYSWSFGDGSKDVRTTGPGAEHIFRGDPRDCWVVLTVTEAGNSRNGTAGSVITIGKPERKPKKQEKKPDREGSNGPAPASPGGGGYGGGSYGGGYGDGTGGGYGGGYDGGSGMPSAPQPAKPKPKPVKPVPPDDGLVPVRGELLDPSIPGQVIDPATREPGESAGPTPSAQPKGFALSGGAKTAIGIAVLLGLGGLAEFRSFARPR